MLNVGPSARCGRTPPSARFSARDAMGDRARAGPDRTGGLRGERGPVPLARPRRAAVRELRRAGPAFGAGLAFPADWRWPEAIAGRGMDTYHRWMEVVVPVSLIGLPALAAPAGFGPTGLPMGFQIFGPQGSDAKLLSIGAAWHQATDWPGRHPPALPS
ncbi:MAG: amidase family protein [Defluviimonas denitrificans]